MLWLHALRNHDPALLACAETRGHHRLGLASDYWRSGHGRRIVLVERDSATCGSPVPFGQGDVRGHELRLNGAHTLVAKRT